MRTHKLFGWCKNCGEYFTFNSKQGGQNQKYCSVKCREQFHNRKYEKANREWQRKHWGRYEPGRIQCKICGLWYVQVGSHVVQRHGITARQYRELMDMDVKRGTVPDWYREMKGEQAIENGSWKNLLKAGKKYRFKKGDPRLQKYGRGRGYKPTLDNEI